MEFLIDLEAQLPTRRYVNTLIEDHQVVAICKLAQLNSSKDSGTLFSQLLEIFTFYTGFEINGHTGLALTKEEMTEIHASKLTKLQVMNSFKLAPTKDGLTLDGFAAEDTNAPSWCSLWKISASHLLISRTSLSTWP